MTGACHDRPDSGEINGQRPREPARRPTVAPQPRLLGISFARFNHSRATSHFGKVCQRRVIDREKRRRGAILGAHVRDRGPVWDRQRVKPHSGELDDLVDDTRAAQACNEMQRNIGCGHARDPLTGHDNLSDGRQRYRHRRSQRGKLGFDTADAPPENAKSVDHGRVAVCTDHGLCHGPTPLAGYGSGDDGKLFEIDLVADTVPGWDYPQFRKGLLCPLEEPVALFIAREFKRMVQAGSIGPSTVIGPDGMVYDQIYRDCRIDCFSPMPASNRMIA